MFVENKNDNAKIITTFAVSEQNSTAFAVLYVIVSDHHIAIVVEKETHNF